MKLHEFQTLPCSTLHIPSAWHSQNPRERTKKKLRRFLASLQPPPPRLKQCRHPKRSLFFFSSSRQFRSKTGAQRRRPRRPHFLRVQSVGMGVTSWCRCNNCCASFVWYWNESNNVMHTLQQIWSKYHPSFWVFIRFTHTKWWSNHGSVGNLIPTPTSIRPIFMPERANARKALWAPGPAKQLSNAGCQRDLWHFARRHKNYCRSKVNERHGGPQRQAIDTWHKGDTSIGPDGSKLVLPPPRNRRGCVSWVGFKSWKCPMHQGRIHRFLSFEIVKCFMGNYHFILIPCKKMVTLHSAWCSCLGATSGPQFDVQGINAQLLSTGHQTNTTGPWGNPFRKGTSDKKHESSFLVFPSLNPLKPAREI